jgi:hypothetical protein
MASDLKAAAAQDVAIYMPYYKREQQQALPYAITLYKQGELQGERQIEGSLPVAFVATWRVSNLPSDLTLCNVTFEAGGDDRYKYEITLVNSEFVNYLIEIVIQIRDTQIADFPQTFYSKLFRLKVATSDNN